MTTLETTNLSNQQKAKIFTLWNNEYPARIAYNNLSEFDAYLNNLSDARHIILTTNDGEVIGWAFSFQRDNERWFAIILDSTIQKKGYGTQLLNLLKAYEHALNGWVVDHNADKKINGEYYQSPLDFYLKNSFTTIPDCRLELEKISAVKIIWHR